MLKKLRVEAIRLLSSKSFSCDHIYKIRAQNSPGAVLVALLKACTKNKDLYTGANVHADVVNKGLLGKDPFVASTLVNMYAKCGMLQKAKDVLEGVPVRNVVIWSALIAGYAQAEHGKEALYCFDQMLHEGLFPDAITFACILKACGSIRALDKGRNLHADIVRQGLLEGNPVLGGALVDMYAKCGALAKAKEVLESLPVQNAVAWNAVIAGYAQVEHGKEALNCFIQMQHDGFLPDVVTFICTLKACGSIKALVQGESIHYMIEGQRLLGGNIMLGNALVDMYAKCGALLKANEVLQELPVRDVAGWNSLVTGYAQEEHGKEVLKCCEQMQCEGLSPNAVTYACILKACGCMGALDKGEISHSELVRQGLLEGNVVLGSALVDMYSKCGALTKAKEMLEELTVRYVAAWNALIAGYVQAEHGKEALSCFNQMQCEGLSPDSGTYLSILRACGNMQALYSGEIIHAEVVQDGLLGRDTILGDALISMYSKCGAVAKVKEVFQGLPFRTVGGWNILIAAYVQGQEDEKALICFDQMQKDGLSPNAVTFSCLLKASGSIGALDIGEKLHSMILTQGLLEGNIVLRNALVDMYARCGYLVKAKELLEGLPDQDVVAWNSLIGGYVQGARVWEALNCLGQMQCWDLSPDVVTFVCLLKSCGSIGALEMGEKLHFYIVEQRLLEENVVLGNSLVDMYAKCGALVKAKEVLEGLCVRDVVTWSALVAGYAQQECAKDALNCFEQMQCEGLSPDVVTFVCILKACGSVGALDKGKYMHLEIVRKGFLGGDVVLGGALVDMYAKCGALEKAKEVLEMLPVCSVAAWNALISGYAQKDLAKEAFNCFEQLQLNGLYPNGITFLCIMNACSHAGLFDEGQKLFRQMKAGYCITPSSEHYACMIHLLSCAGLLNEAVAVTKRMPSSYYSVVWVALLSGCKKWGNLDLARWVFDHAVLVDMACVSEAHMQIFVQL